MTTSSGPRWQRARALRTTKFLTVGDLLWVAAGPPDTGWTPDGRPVQTYLLSKPWPADPTIEACVTAENVELLPEFSDAADPDAEVRQ